MKDLLGAGYLKVDEELRIEYPKGQRTYSATLSADGTMDYGGESISPNKWSNRIHGYETNSWTTIAVAATGEKLIEVRERYMEGRKHPGPPASDMDASNSDMPRSDVHSDAAAPQSEAGKVTVPSLSIVKECLNAEIGSPSHSRPNDVSQVEPHKNLREEVAQLSPGDFKELIRQYIEDKGFTGAEITVHLNLTI